MANDYVEVTRTAADDLVHWVWRFWYYKGALWLDEYREYQRPSRRHKPTVTQSYKRIDMRDATIKRAEDVTVYADVMKEAVDTFCKGISVKRWTERS